MGGPSFRQCRWIRARGARPLVDLFIFLHRPDLFLLLRRAVDTRALRTLPMLSLTMVLPEISTQPS